MVCRYFWRSKDILIGAPSGLAALMETEKGRS